MFLGVLHESGVSTHESHQFKYGFRSIYISLFLLIYKFIIINCWTTSAFSCSAYCCV